VQHQFFDTSDLIRKPWIELCRDSRMEVLAGEQTPLHIAVCLGLISLVHQILTGLIVIHRHSVRHSVNGARGGGAVRKGGVNR